ncbi:MAG: hypothetical protein Ct9H300mP11_31950 [Chloroflexota bacterium]|nr:MAG: hypothetical protein Ct9H300mP11_31950 [Chloroflexota bacterium]
MGDILGAGTTHYPPLNFFPDEDRAFPLTRTLKKTTKFRKNEISHKLA